MVARTPNTASPSLSARRRRGNFCMRTPTDSSANLDVNNDEEERKQRKRSILLSNNLLSPVAGHTTPRSRITSTTDSEVSRNHAGMTYAQLREHNANCVKLSSENKINAKNAFALHLIDYMKVLVRQSQKEDDTTNFQSASCTLDAGVKIYAGRVDSVHADAYKMLGSLGRATVGEEEMNEDQLNGEQDKQPKKKKTMRGPGKTIEKNPKSLNCEKFDLTFEVDPFFHKTSATFDEGGTSGLLSNHLLIKDETFELMLDSEHKIMNSEDTEENPVKSPINLAPFKDITARLFNDNIEICTQFRDFMFTDWDKNSQDWLLNDSKKNRQMDDNHRFDQDASLLEPENGDDVASDVSDFVGDFGDECNFPDNGGEQPLLTDDNEFNRASNDANKGNFAQRPFADAVQLEFFLQPSEYSYFRQDVLDAWAGPNHWKVRSKLREIASRSNQNEGETTKRKRDKKALFTFNYDDDSVIKDIRKPGKKTAKTLSNVTLKKMSALQTTLPEDVHYDAESFLKLFIKPSIRVRRQFNSNVEGEAGLCEYNYGNRCDTDNFCPAFQDGDDDDYDGSDGNMINNTDGMYGDSVGNFTQPVFDDTVGEQTFFGGDNLVSQPNKIEKISIAYAKTAKRIDIKKLKRAMWETFNSSETQIDKENIPENISATLNSEEKKEDIDNHTASSSFKEIYSKLPNKLSQTATKNLSVPIAFVCLLYLANEKGLQLTGSEDLSNFSIAKDNFDTKIES